MKYLILIAALVLPSIAYCDDLDDLAKILRETECSPVRDKAGNVKAYHCDGPGSEGLNKSAPNSKLKTMELTSELEDADLLDTKEEAKLAQ